MVCPFCGSSRVDQVEYDGIKLWYCNDCEQEWGDEEEEEEANKL